MAHSEVTLKVISLNFWEGRHATDACAFLGLAQPDIVALQEVPRPSNAVPTPQALADPNYSSWGLLQRALQGYHVAWAPTFSVEGPHGAYTRGNVIFSRFPIVEESVVFADVGPGAFVENYQPPADHNYINQPTNFQVVLLSVEGATLKVMNVHGLWDRHADDSPGRRQLIVAMAGRITDPSNTIVLGDFNMSCTAPSLQTLVAKGLRSVFDEDDFEGRTTFNVSLLHNVIQRIPNFRAKVIDMIFIGDRLKIMEKSASQEPTMSDHIPLVATLCLQHED